MGSLYAWVGVWGLAVAITWIRIWDPDRFSLKVWIWVSELNQFSNLDRTLASADLNITRLRVYGACS